MGEIAVGHEVEADRVREFKMNWLLSAGFSLDNARKIAESNIDWHFAVDAMTHAKGKGYDEEFVVKLLL